MKSASGGKACPTAVQPGKAKKHDQACQGNGQHRAQENWRARMPKLTAHDAEVRTLVKATADATLEELVAALAGMGIASSR